MRRRCRHIIAVVLCCFVVCGMLPQSSFGLVITSPATNYEYAPYDNPGWDNVGQMSNGTGVYLGDGWVLTPYHVYRREAGHSYIQLDRRYDEIFGTSRRIELDGTNADLVMFRINGNPDLDLIEIRETAVPNSESATLISIGRIKDGNLQEWVIEDETYWGFGTTTPRAKRWGRNRVFDYNGSMGSGQDFGETEALYARFDQGQSDEAQPVDKDSGGGVFIKVGSTWELAGMILLVGPNYPYDPHEVPPPEVTPGTHAIYGSYAYYADLMAYHEQISNIRDIRLPGDADRNGRVDIVDFSILRGSFGQSGSDITPYFNADFDDDLDVDKDDLGILENHFGMVSGGYNHPDQLEGGAPAMALVLVPEPATIFVLIGAVPLLLKSPRRRGRA